MTRFIVFCIAFLLFSCNPIQEESKSPSLYTNAEFGAVVSAHPLASKVGMDVLKSGGNAFDAAIATYMSLAVVYPRAGNIGGGGFMVYHRENGESASLDFREKAPNAAFRDMYLDENDLPIKGLSRLGALSIAVPGSVAGMEAIHEKFSTKSWQELLKPAIDQAANGYTLSANEANIINRYYADLLKQNGEVFYLIKNGEAFQGDTIHPSKLAACLLAISQKGKRAFYEDEIAEDIVRSVRKNGGIITLKDLKDYEVVWRNVIEIDFNGYKVISMPPPSSGGIALSQLLYGFNYLKGQENAYNSCQFIHLNTELQRRVYADRAEFLGDPDFVNNPQETLLNSDYLNSRFSDISKMRASPSLKINKGQVMEVESVETTHISILDKWGNAVSITTTLNGNFGSKLACEKNGFLLNNQMDDFSIKPGYPNQFGLVGNKQNAIEGGKRMLSSMTPSIVIKDDAPILIAGTPGGSTIITSVYQTILATLVYDLPAQESVNLAKYHSQWLPDIIYYEENRRDSLLLDSLIQMGHKVDSKPRLGKMKVVLALDNYIDAAGDTLRGDDKAVVE